MTEEDEADCTNEDQETNHILFVEEQEVLHLIAQLSPTNCNDDSSSHIADSLRRLRVIFDKYLECPTLLDQSFECLIETLSKPVVDILHVRERRRFRDHGGDVRDHGGDGDNSPTNSQVREDILVFIDSIRYHLSTMYYICKVRGRKYVQRFLPHHVSDVIPVWIALRTILEHQQRQLVNTVSSSTINSSSTAEVQHTISEDIAPIWETTYVLWIWMSTLSLVPFDCNKFAEESALTVTSDDSVSEQVPFITQLMDTCYHHLNDSGRIRDGVSVCLASWLSRPDTTTSDQQHLSTFVGTSIKALQTFVANSSRSSNDLFTVIGILQTLTTILKTSSIPREDLLQQFLPLWGPSLQLSQQATNDIILQKLLTKWWTRIGCALLPPRLASWRYQRGKRLLFQAQNTTSITTTTTSASPGSIHAANDIEGEMNIEDDLIIPNEVEFAMGRIIDGLSNSSTIVRWSAAKGVGRITERLPSLCAEDVLDAILLLFHDTNNDRCWHGACLALAELARRGLLLPHRLHEVVPYLVKAVQYDRRRGSITVGAHVRDAACYTYWAFARAYERNVLQVFISVMTLPIILNSLFDREVNCRRAAGSAFQEAVGRLGATNFPHGIEILTAADYFSLGNRTNAYLSIAIQIATYNELRHPIIQHLYTTKLYHWDINIRTLTSKAINKLTTLDPKFMCDVVIPTLLEKCLDEKDLFTRHGAVLGVAEIVLALSTSRNLHCLPSNIEELLTELVPMIERKRLYRGRGGEIMRSAVCRLMECISLAEIPLTVKGQVRLLDSIESNIPHPTETIQEDACRALEALMTTYFPVGAAGPSVRLQQRVFNKFIETIQTTENPAVVRGYVLALGHLPAKLICPTMDVLQSILNCLATTSHHTALVGKESDAESRRNSLRSLVRICRLLLNTDRGAVNVEVTALYPTVGMNKDIFEQLCATFLNAMDDYRTDRRGDVGCWCRLVGMEGITELLLTVASMEETKTVWIVDNAMLVTTTVGAILKQLSEKLDFVRHRAGSCIQQLLLSPYLVDVIVSHSELLTVLNLSNSNDSELGTNTNWWIDPSCTFTMVMDVVSVTNNQIYFEQIITGIVSSIGGLTEDVNKHSSSSVLNFMKQTSSTDRKEQLIMYVTTLLHQRNNRLVQPILKTLDLLLTHGCCHDVIIHQLNLERDGFIELCRRCLQREVNVSTNVVRLLLVVDVLVSIVTALLLLSRIESRRCTDVVEKKRSLIAFLCSMLLHPFPRVRSYVAEQMYTYILENDDNVANYTRNNNNNSSSSDDAIINSGNNDMVQQWLLNTRWSDEEVVSSPSTINSTVPFQIATALGVSTEFQSLIIDTK